MILGHVVGINNKIKKHFLDELTNISPKNIILDLDDISKKIIFEKEYTVLYEKFISSQNKIHILSLLSQLWKVKFTQSVNEFIEKNKDKYIILVGMNTFYLDLRIRVNFTEEIKNKFFINTNTDVYLKNLTEFNLDTYRDDIINGKFPLKYLDHAFLKSQRENIRDVYLLRDYKMKTYDDILEFIKQFGLRMSGGNMDPVFFASSKRYENKIDMISSTIIGYSDRWLSLISLFPRNKFTRGFTFKGETKTPCIKELGPYNLQDLNMCCYVYEMYPCEKIDDYRYLIDDNKFIRRYYVSNIHNELKMDGVVFDNYKT